MFTVRAIPLQSGSPPSELSYFSKGHIHPGSLVIIPIRNKKTPALVVESLPASEQKALLKKGTFPLKKIASADGREIFLRSFLKGCAAAAVTHAQAVGSIIKLCTPLALLSDLPALSDADARGESALKPPVLAYEAPYSERVELYQRTIRSTFAKGKSVYVIVPTIEEAERLKQALEKGIEHRAHLFTSAVSKKKLIKEWQKAIEAPEPVLAIMTYSFLSLPRSDLELIILERESARSYFPVTRPVVPMRSVILSIAETMNVTVMLSDDIMSVQTRAAVHAGLCDAVEELKTRFSHAERVRILDLRNASDGPKRPFAPIHPSLLERIEFQVAHQERTFLFGSRRGYANTVVCNDCGERVSCAVCNNPVALETAARSRQFVCRRCHATRNAKETCKACGSWNLIELGIGVERIHEFIAKKFGKEHVYRIDTDTAPDHKKASLVRNRWMEDPSGILIGTERALPFLGDRLALSSIVAVDSLLALPEWQAHERIFSIISSLARISDEVIVQSRRPKEPVLHFASLGDVKEFSDAELALRKQFEYPPFATLLTLTLSGTHARVEKEAKSIDHLLAAWHPHKTAQKKPNEKVMVLYLIRIPHAVSLTPRIPSALAKAVTTLPPFVSVAVNPPSTRG